MHFIGNEADDLVKRLQLPSGILDIENSMEIFKLLNELISEYKANNPYKEEIATGYLYEILTLAARKNQTVKETDRFIKVIETIHTAPLTDNETLAQICHFSKAHFIRKFEERYGISPLKYRQKILIEQAKELLENNKTLSVTEISKILGFEDNPLYFYKLFKLHTGKTPNSYRESLPKKKE